VHPYLLTMRPAPPLPAAAVDDATLAAAASRANVASRVTDIHALAWMMASGYRE